MSTSVSSTSGNLSVTGSSGTISSSATSSLADFESFIEILCVQLQNQDPTDPVENTELVSQLAQMSTLEQLSSMNDTLDAYSAFSLIGQDVSYSTTNDSGTTTTGSGTVSAVTISSGAAYLTVDGTSVSYSDLTSVNGTAT